MKGDTLKENKMSCNFKKNNIFFNNCYNTVYYYSYSFNLLLVDFYFLLAQSQYNLLNRHVLGSATSKFSHFTVSFSFEGEILEKINSIETEDLSKANSVL